MALERQVTAGFDTPLSPLSRTDEFLAELVGEVRGLRADLAARAAPKPVSSPTAPAKKAAPAKRAAKKAAPVELDGR